MRKLKYRVGHRRLEETYIKAKAICCYFYSAVDKLSNTVDFLLTKRRERMSAQSFLIKAINNSKPRVININKWVEPKFITLQITRLKAYFILLQNVKLVTICCFSKLSYLARPYEFQLSIYVIALYFFLSLQSTNVNFSLCAFYRFCSAG